MDNHRNLCVQIQSEMDYQKFRKDYESSGLSQRAYGEQISMSSSMVGYYLRKARAQQKEKRDSVFQEVRILDAKSGSQHIKITTPSGLEISIPIC